MGGIPADVLQAGSRLTNSPRDDPQSRATVRACAMVAGRSGGLTPKGFLDRTLSSFVDCVSVQSLRSALVDAAVPHWK